MSQTTNKTTPHVAYEQREQLLTDLRATDASLDWHAAFVEAREHTEEGLRSHEATIIKATPQTPAWKTGIHYGVRSAGLCVLAVLAYHIIPNTSEQIAYASTTPLLEALGAGVLSFLSLLLAFISGVATFLLLFMGTTISLTEYVDIRTQRKALREFASGGIKALVPSAISYQLTSTVGRNGEVLAHIQQRSPAGKREVGVVELGLEHSAGEISERFTKLQEELRELEGSAASERYDYLREHGVDASNEYEVLASLQAHAETARDRRQMHRGVVATLNKAATEGTEGY